VLWGLRAAWIAVLCSMVSFGVLTAQAFTSANADALFDAHTKAFYQETNGRAWFKESTEGGKVSYWTRAEQMEMVLDAYERTTDTRPLVMFTNLFHGFLADHGRTWERNEYNDDIMWMVIACTRAHLLTGNPEFRDVARTNFDLCYARAASTNLGGGLWWKTDNRCKNACVNGPGAIAAFLLGRTTGEGAYFTKATNLFLWERATLYDPATGRVFDNINTNGRVRRFALTYNQGTFVGAANLLGFTNEARMAATFTMNALCKDGYLPPAGEKGDGGGFNGIGVRWIVRFMEDRSEQATFEPWLQKNAEAAWLARRTSDNLSWCRWPQPTPEDRRYSWGCSSAVVILQVVRPAPNALPGKGLAEHDFFYAGEAKEENMYIIKGGRIVWFYTHPGRGEISDAILLANNNVLFAHQYAITEVTADKRVVWNYDAPPNTEIHTAQPFGTNSVWFVQNGDPAKFMVVNKTSGKTEREFILPVKNPKGVHGQFRQARMTAASTLLVAHMDLGKAVEYDLNGKALWSAEVPGIWSAKPLQNGHILATSNRGFVRELNRQGQVVWEWTLADAPDCQMISLQTATRLANGNTIINNWFNQWSNSKLDQANPPVQAIEINREKQVVWILRSWTPPEDLGPSTTIQILGQ
jgi:predicted alpha-1,6-mannanase (GH76 family)